ncbi:MAG: insulinase family protein [Candidatus Hydrogenedentales bacterium]
MTLTTLCANLAVAETGFRKLGSLSPDDPLQVQRFELDNGLQVYLTVNRDEPRFYAEIAVRAGSKNDPPEATGLAHYMEHLLFKGSQRLGTVDYEKEKSHLQRIEELYEEHFNAKDEEERRRIYDEITRESTAAAAFAVPNELDQLYRTMGGKDINAHTWHEEVVYKVNLPMNCLEQWAALESDRFRDPVFRLFQTELETVYEEMNRALDNKMRLIQNAVNAQLFKVHPYGQQPTLGLVEHLKKPSIKRLNNFFETWYTPKNMAIFISGDIDVGGTMETIVKYFGDWQPHPLPEKVTWNEAPLTEREEVRVQYEAEPFVFLAFRTVPSLDEDVEALVAFDMILDNAVAGLINLNLNQKQRVRLAGSFPMFMNDYGVQYFYAIPKDGQPLEEVEALLLEQINLVKEGAFEDWIIPAIINDYKKREKVSFESNTSRVELMRRSWIAFTEWEYAYKSIERLEKVTREDVVRVAKKYFDSGYIAGFREDKPHTPPKVDKPPLPDFSIDSKRRSKFAEEILSLPLEPITPVFLKEGENYQHVVDPSGLELYYAANPLNDVFNLSIIVDYGTDQDPRMSIASRLMERIGTTEMDSSALQNAWYKLGTGFSVTASKSQFTILLIGLDKSLGSSLRLLSEMVENPSVDSETLEELKQIILVQREDAKKDPDTLSAAVVNYARYGDESPWLNMIPAEEVRALTAQELHDAIRSALKSRHSLLYSGTLAPEEVLTQYKEIFIHQESLDEPVPYKSLAVHKPEENEIYFLERPMTQTHVTIEFGDVPFDPELNAAIKLYNNYFSGSMSGIVFQELREVRALAYIVGANYRQGDRVSDTNILTGIIQTQADKTIEAVTAFVDLLDNLPQSDERYKAVKEAALNNLRSGRISFRAIPLLVLALRYRGLDYDPREKEYATIMAAETDDLLFQFHREHIQGKKKMISIIGEAERVDFDALKEIAPVKEVTVKDIFVD